MKSVIRPCTNRLRKLERNREQAWALFKELREKPLAQPEKEAFVSALRFYIAREGIADLEFMEELR